MKIVQSLIDDAKSKGARILSGGGPVDFKECKDGTLDHLRFPLAPPHSAAFVSEQACSLLRRCWRT